MEHWKFVILESKFLVRLDFVELIFFDIFVLKVLKYWRKTSETYRTFVVDTIEHQNCCLAPPIIQIKSVSQCGLFVKDNFNDTSLVDLWSLGVVFSEIILGHPLFFHEETAIDHLVDIIEKLGTPTREDIKAMNNKYTRFTFPEIIKKPFHTFFSPNTPKDCLDLLKRLFVYNPENRIHPLHACAHPFFDELRVPGKKWHNGNELPPLFNFTREELMEIDKENLREMLVPRANCWWFWGNLVASLVFQRSRSKCFFGGSKWCVTMWQTFHSQPQISHSNLSCPHLYGNIVVEHTDTAALHHLLASNKFTGNIHHHGKVLKVVRPWLNSMECTCSHTLTSTLEYCHWNRTLKQDVNSINTNPRKKEIIIELFAGSI